MNSKKSDSPVMRDFLKIFIVPVFFNKLVMLYFGLNYSEHPGEGYGYGLTASILFFIFSCVRFIWKYRHIEDP